MQVATIGITPYEDKFFRWGIQKSLDCFLKKGDAEGIKKLNFRNFISSLFDLEIESHIVGFKCQRDDRDLVIDEEAPIYVYYLIDKEPTPLIEIFWEVLERQANWIQFTIEQIFEAWKSLVQDRHCEDREFGKRILAHLES
ncbi:MAG: hypothetical protein ABIF84_01795 [Patescibacteria group bacterium]